MSESRREIAARQIGFFSRLAKWLVRLGFTPNQVSVASSVFALVAGWALYRGRDVFGLEGAIYLIVAIFGVQMRLVCNLIDGLMAVEGGLKTKSGELFNDVPDRFSDVVIFLGAGWWTGAMDLAWLASLLAILTAYARTLGAAMTGKHDFCGPMAKQHRMFLITLGCLVGVVQCFANIPFAAMYWALALIALGSFLTICRRLYRIYRTLEG